MKKLTALLLAVLMVVAVYAAAPVSASDTPPSSPSGAGCITIKNPNKSTTYSLYRVFDLETDETYSAGETASPSPSDAPGAYKYTVNSSWEGLLQYSSSSSSGGSGSGSDSTTFDYETYFKVVDPDKHVEWVKKDETTGKETGAAEFAELLDKYLAANNADTSDTKIDPVKTQTSDEDGNDITFYNLPLGYYFVKSDTGSLCALDTTNPSVDIQNKNPRPYLEKYVQEDSLKNNAEKKNGWGATNDADIGQTVTFRIIVGVDAGDTNDNSQNYTVHDTLEKSGDNAKWELVTVNPNTTPFTIKCQPQTGEESTITVTGYSDSSATNETSTDTTPPARTCTYAAGTDGETFTLTFGNLQTNDTIYIEYTAKLTKDATVGDDGNKNTATLQCKTSTEGGATIQWLTATTTTYTWELPIFKYYSTTTGEGDSATTTQTGLEGAEFRLYYKETTGEGASATTTKHYAVAKQPTTAATANSGDATEETPPPSPTPYIFESWDVATTTEGTTTYKENTTFTSDSNGLISIEGLDAGTYFLEEIKAPSGYNMLQQPLKIVISSTETTADTGTTRTVSYTEYKWDTNDYDSTGTTFTTLGVENKTGTELPATGGIGTTLFYVLGAVLVLGVAVVFTVRRRMSVEG